MANFSVLGFFAGARYTDNAVIVLVAENRAGYKSADGKVREDLNFVWEVVFKPYFKKFVSSNFRKGTLVSVRGEVLQKGDGYVVLGQALNTGTYPRYLIPDRRARHESQAAIADGELPDLAAYGQEDF